MLGWLKNLFVAIFVIGIIIFSSYMTIEHTNNVRAISEVDGAIRSTMLGETRGMGISAGIDKDEFYGAVVEGVVTTQKKHNKTVRVEYIFLDKDRNRTEESEQIKAVQYELSVVNKNGVTQSKAVKSLAISDLGEGNVVVPDDVKVVNVEFGKTEDSVRSKTVTIGDLGQVVSVTTDNGNVSYTVNGKDVTVNVAGGTAIRKLVSGEYTPSDTKYVNKQSSPNYNKDGYVGVLTKYNEGSTTVPDESKHVTNQTTQNYNSGGFVGTLTRYLHSGEFIQAQSKYVSGQSSNYYNDGVYSGNLTERESKSRYVSDGYYTTDYKRVSTGGYYENGGYYKTVPGKTICEPTPPGWMAPCAPVYYPPYDVWVPTQTWVPTYDYVEVTRWVDTSYYETYYLYSGTVVKPEVDTRVYRYQGTVIKKGVSGTNSTYQGYVTKSAVDTRKYESTYGYNVVVKYK